MNEPYNSDDEHVSLTMLDGELEAEHKGATIYQKIGIMVFQLPLKSTYKLPIQKSIFSELDGWWVTKVYPNGTVTYEGTYNGKKQTMIASTFLVHWAKKR